MATLEPGSNFDRYRIIKQIGQGGMGQVFLMEDARLKAKVAIKVLSPNDTNSVDQAVGRFIREAQAAFKLRHPNIIRIHDVRQFQDLHFIVMDYVDGRPLSEMVSKEGAMPQERMLAISRQIALALLEAHSHGVVHRDIKPANILITGEDQVVVTDFGIAKVSSETQHTTAGSILGTLRYASPEQIEGSKVDARSDLYSLSVVMYEMATGVTPFHEERNTAGLMYKTIRETPPIPRLVNPQVSKSLSNLIMKGLEKRPENRIASAQEMIDAIDGVAGGGKFSHLVLGRSLGWLRALTWWQQAGLATSVLAVLVCGVIFGPTLLEQLAPRPAGPGVQVPQVDPKLLAQAKDLTQKGEQAAVEGDFPSARTFLEQALKKLPAHEPASQALAGLAARQKKAEGDAHDDTEQGDQAAKEGRLEQAERFWRKALQRVKDYPPALAGINSLPELRAKAQRAEQEAAKARQEAKSLTARADRLAEEGKFEEAQRVLEEALRKVPGFEDALKVLASLPGRQTQRKIDEKKKTGQDPLEQIVLKADQQAKDGNYDVAIGMLNMASPMAKDNITLRNTINNKIEEYSRQKTR